MAVSKKVIVVGAGPGGYIAAIRASQLGADVTVIEKDHLGGTCLNVGCIPTKALLSCVDILGKVRAAEKFGIKVGEVLPDFRKMVERSQKIVSELREGIAFLFKKNGVKLLKGTCESVKKGAVRISAVEGGDIELEGDAIIVATGSIPAMPAAFGYDGERVISSNEALWLSEVPKKLVVVGGGAVGLEFACIFSSLGSKVAVVEMMAQLIPGHDAEIASQLERILSKKNISVYKETRVEKLEKGGNQVSVGLSNGDELQADKVLVAVGRIPNTGNLELPDGVLKDEKGFLRVNQKMETRLPGIYAIGDAIGAPFLAHKASFEGVVASENALGMDVSMRYDILPGCIFTEPEIASVGLTEQEAREKGREIKIGKFPFNALGKARVEGRTEGMVKVVADAGTAEIIGIHIIGPGACDIIAEASIAMKLEGTLEDITDTIHSHPTLAEALREASLVAQGKGIHV